MFRLLIAFVIMAVALAGKVSLYNFFLVMYKMSLE